MLPPLSIMRFICGTALIATWIFSPAQAGTKPVKVFVIAGDEDCLETGMLTGQTESSDVSFFADAAPTPGERGNHVNCAVYKGAYVAGTDYRKLTPEATGLVGLGVQRRGKTPEVLPALALKDGYTTVLRGYISVPQPGQYEVMPGKGEPSFSVTTVEGKVAYMLNVGQTKPTMAAVTLEAKKRHAFETIYFRKPGTELLVPRINVPGTLDMLVAEKKERWGFLKGADGGWSKRDDVVLYDAHPLSNNTRAPGRFLQLRPNPADPRALGVGVDRMFGHVLGEASNEPVLLIRFATRHPVWFLRGSRSLGYDYLSSSGGGGLDFEGGWDVIHFNHGVWDQQYMDINNPNQKAEPGHGRIRTSIEDYEKNLRSIVARLKQTKATLIWASTTPILAGTPGFVGGEMVDKYNEVAAKVMNENGVIIDDLNAESRRLGAPRTHNVHDVGNLAPKVTETILAALKARQNPSRPIPRVLMIGDSITGGYLEKVTKNLDGKAFVGKNPGNAEHSGTGARLVDQWVDIKRYLLNGQEYLELIDGVKQTLKDFDRYCPDFAGHTPELAGLVWFQGIADAQSDAFAAAYEKNLTGFIRDVRGEFNQPGLPVVVAALGQYGKDMQPAIRKVHDAQMAVGDPGKHPEFKGNVASIDTIPFFFAKEKSPGGREWDYYNNAESFLLIGEALGRAMIDLTKNRK